MGSTALDDGALLADPTLHALYEFTELIAANVRSSRQRTAPFASVNPSGLRPPGSSASLRPCG